ncbi:metallophosphoesterase family protein [Antarcticirhabdus aurantiaca]|uniref:Metallophosphoesterase family protein n=1 Tax=Antarcticirhabdus aurantiaca TaxID=2606717 RepID=A0ACD4NLS8_9HYPH|nr:metallophosphoesterase family protein [Antarcticirhabdus aurantiaca]WAJ27665.1 metallophosphoesterase family protein [Jeongeuplla avenae]
MAVFFTADTHFDDPRILRIDKRPFASLPEHDAGLIANWNAVVSPADTVFHLGDFARGTPAAKAAILDRLAGEKHLISGNNDDEATLALSGWRSVSAYREIDLDGRRLILCHYAFRTWNAMGKGSLDLHGHSHGKLTPQPRQYDVGVDAQGFKPVTLAEILVSRRGRAAPNKGVARGRASGAASQT